MRNDLLPTMKVSELLQVSRDWALKLIKRHPDAIFMAGSFFLPVLALDDLRRRSRKRGNPNWIRKTTRN